MLKCKSNDIAYTLKINNLASGLFRVSSLHKLTSFIYIFLLHILSNTAYVNVLIKIMHICIYYDLYSLYYMLFLRNNICHGDKRRNDFNFMK